MKNRKKNKNHHCLFYTCKQKAWNKLRKSFLAQTRRLNDGNDKSGIKTELWAVGPRNERTRRREKKSAKRSEAVRRFLAAIIGIPVTIGRSTETDVTSTSAQFAWRCGIAPLTPPLHSFPHTSPDPHRFRILELTSARPCYDRTTLFEPSFWRNMCEYVNIYRIYVGMYIDFRQCINMFRPYVFW